MLFKSISRVAVILAATLVGGFVSSAVPQDMKNMPGMKMGNSNSQKKRMASRKKPAVKKHNMANVPGMNMPGMKMSSTHRMRHRRRQSRARSTMKPGMRNMPGMTMPGMKMPGTKPSSTPTASPQQMNMPGMQMPTASPNPQASPQPQMQMNMPGMQMPQASPSPGAQPGASPQTQMNMPMPGASPSASPMGQMPGMNMGGMNMNMGPLMVMTDKEMAVQVGSSEKDLMSMGAMGSGTSWQPSSGPMHMHYKVAGDWLLMFHYNLIVAMNRQGGPRGVMKLDSANWFMPMAYHKLGQGTLQLRGMFSAEPFTFPPGGSPLLFQTGETYRGQPLVDKQHPHDLFMELSAQYTHPLGERGTWFTYFGYPGEPALGPVAFMDRMSASENPSATLSHHLQDSTHISFGVLTTGFTYRWFKLEGSLFNGREPVENRYNFDAHKWISRSARLWLMPNRNWAMQVSYGFLGSPEAQEPNADIRRATASVQYYRAFNRGNWASALIWGRHRLRAPGEVPNRNRYTFEATVD